MRAFAIYACQYYGRVRLKDIAGYFNLSHVGSVSKPIARIKKEVSNGQWKKEIGIVEKSLFTVKHT